MLVRFARCCWGIAVFSLICLGGNRAWAGESNRLFAVSVRPHAGFTRLALKLEQDPRYSLSFLSGNRVRLELHDTDGSRWKRLRSYADGHVKGCRITRRGGDLLVTVAVKGDPHGVRAISIAGTATLALDVGSELTPPRRSPLSQGREGIKVGVAQLVTSFDPPLKSEIPFLPSDRRVLEKKLPPEEISQVFAGEAALYHGNGGEAETIFAPLAIRRGPAQALALYRLGEAKYMLQKYGEALAAFQGGEKLWPEFLVASPATTFSYADSIVRKGDLERGRRLLDQLIARLADKSYAPILLVRLADILSRQGKDIEAVAIYRTVADGFPNNKARYQARMKLADRQLVSLEPAVFEGLAQNYLDIYQQGGDFALREEGLFKAALLVALYGDAAQAYTLMSEYERKFSHGVYVTIARGVREELLVPISRQLVAADDRDGLVKLALDNREFLAKCLTEPDFIAKLSAAFATGNRRPDEVKLYSFLIGKEWGRNPLLYQALIDDAEVLGDLPLLERAAGDFVRDFPDHPSAQGYRERLAVLAFNRGDMSQVVMRLSDLLQEKRHPEAIESLYYLGKAMDRLGNHRGAERAMLRFLTENRQHSGGTTLVPDAYYVAATACLSRNDRIDAVALFQAGSEVAPAGARDPFVYKLGELARNEKRYADAVRYFQTVVREGKDPEWKKMASQALADMELSRQLAQKLPVSK